MIMKKNSYLEKIRNHSVVEINKSLNEERSKLNSLRFDLFAGKVKNVRAVKSSRKNIARLLTILKEKENQS